MGLLPVEEARARILEGVTPTAPERVPIAEAHGRVLAEDLAAKLTQPPFNASAMDGYAVRAADVAETPSRLTVVGMSAAGRGHRTPLGAREAVRIFTGAPLPEGADTVVIQENTERDGDTVIVTEPARRSANVREQGIDFRAGDVLIGAGRTLDPHVVTLAPAMGHGVIAVRRRPVVAILATGDELAAPGTAPGPDQIISSNPLGIAAIAERAGAMPRLLGIAGDSKAAIEEKIASTQDADVLVTVGGASVGDHDLVGAALAARGMTLDFWKIAMRPGKPLLFGRLGGKRVLGLPGNPVSALVCAHVFLAPLVRALLGAVEERAPRRTARLAESIEANGPRTHYMRAKLSRTSSGELAVAALPSQDSSLLSALARSDCFIVRPPHAPAAAAGEDVEIERFSF